MNRMWKVEEIPYNDKLFYRIHITFLDDKKQIKPGAFREMGDDDAKSMSTDWAKYSTAQESKDRAKKPDNNCIVSFVKGKITDINLNVRHSPDFILKNRAHTDVKGINVETRLKLLDMYLWKIPFDSIK